MIDGSLLTTLVTWVVNISYVLAILPQVFLNYKIKSTKGLSDLYLVGYFNGYAVTFFYVYTLNFHIAYKVRAILAVLVVGVMIWQRFFYEDGKINAKTRKLYTADLSIMFLLAPFVFKFPNVAGQIAGWALVVIWSLYQLPQIFKIHRNKSVDGFSFILVSLIGIGNLIELFITYYLNYPIQTQIIAVRGILIYLIFMFQFWRYRNKKTVLQIVKQEIKIKK